MRAKRRCMHGKRLKRSPMRNDVTKTVGKKAITKGVTETVKKIANEFGLSLSQAKEALKAAGGKVSKLPMVIPTLFGAVMDKMFRPDEKSFQSTNYQAIMYDKYFDPKTSIFDIS